MSPSPIVFWKEHPMARKFQIFRADSDDIEMAMNLRGMNVSQNVQWATIRKAIDMGLYKAVAIPESVKGADNAEDIFDKMNMSGEGYMRPGDIIVWLDTLETTACAPDGWFKV